MFSNMQPLLGAMVSIAIVTYIIIMWDSNNDGRPPRFGG